MSSFISPYWVNHAIRYRLIAIAALSALLGLALASYNDDKNHQRTLDNAAHIYGDSLTQLAADQSSTSTFEKDPISLQAIARNIADKRAVTSMIIYDIDNQILAQINGKPQPSISDVKHFTAPIIASNNVIGSITLGVAPSLLNTPHNRDLIIATAAVLLLAFIISVIKLYLLNEVQSPANPADAESPANAKPSSLQAQPDDDGSSREAPMIATPHTALDNIYLLLQVKNMAVLYQQLNGESRKQQIDVLEQHVKQAISLYNGEVIATSDEGVLLTFSEDKTDSIYNALYTGELVLKLNQQAEKSILVLNAFIQKAKSTTPLLDTLDATRRGIQGNEHQLFIDNSFVTDYHLDSHLDTSTLEKTSLAMVKNFKGSYATLLDNQLRQLQSH